MAKIKDEESFPPGAVVNEVVIWGLLIQNSLPGKKTIRIETVAILVTSTKTSLCSF